MPMRKDFSIWRVIWNQAIMSIKAQEICSVQEANKTDLIERISQTVAATLTVVRLLFVRTVVVNVWVATLSLVVNIWQKGSHLLIKE